MTEKNVSKWFTEAWDEGGDKFECRRRFIRLGIERGYIEKAALEKARELVNKNRTGSCNSAFDSRLESIANFYEQAVKDAKE